MSFLDLGSAETAHRHTYINVSAVVKTGFQSGWPLAFAATTFFYLYIDTHFFASLEGNRKLNFLHSIQFMFYVLLWVDCCLPSTKALFVCILRSLIDLCYSESYFWNKGGKRGTPAKPDNPTSGVGRWFEGFRISKILYRDLKNFIIYVYRLEFLFLFAQQFEGRPGHSCTPMWASTNGQQKLDRTRGASERANGR